MAFTKLKLTTFGQAIEAKRHQGKGIKFTRVAIGDGLLGNGSMVNRMHLVNERHSMKIDGILTTDDGKQSVVVVTLDNKEFTEGFLYRELGLLAQDPDTNEEGVYLYDNAGSECEYLDTIENGVVIYERIKLQIRVEPEENIIFEESGNPLYLSAEDVEGMIQQHNAEKDAHPNKADLGDDGKVLPDQLPEMNYDPAGSAKAVKDELDTHKKDTENPHNVTAEQVKADPAGSASKVQDNLDSHIRDKENPHGVTPAKIGAAVTSKAVDITLAASSWSSANPPTLTVTVSGLGAAQNGTIGVAKGATQARRKAAAAAQIGIQSQAAGSLTLVADGTKPSINIPATVILLG